MTVTTLSLLNHTSPQYLGNGAKRLINVLNLYIILYYWSCLSGCHFKRQVFTRILGFIDKLNPSDRFTFYVNKRKQLLTCFLVSLQTRGSPSQLQSPAPKNRLEWTLHHKPLPCLNLQASLPHLLPPQALSHSPGLSRWSIVFIVVL